MLLHIARAHSIRVQTSDQKDYLRDMLRVHACDVECINNLIVFVLLKMPQQHFAHQIMAYPFSNINSFRDCYAASQRLSHSRASQSEHLSVRDNVTHQADAEVVKVMLVAMIRMVPFWSCYHSMIRTIS